MQRFGDHFWVRGRVSVLPKSCSNKSKMFTFEEHRLKWSNSEKVDSQTQIKTTYGHSLFLKLLKAFCTIHTITTIQQSGETKCYLYDNLTQ